MNLSRTVPFKTTLTRPRGELTRLYKQARENEARLVDDLDIAREVQQQLLPRGTPAFPGLDLAAACIPARELGGDFYDFFSYSSGRLALALGDVSANHPTGGRARPRGLYPYSRDEACGHGSNAAGPIADGGEQESLLAERSEVGTNLGGRKVE